MNQPAHHPSRKPPRGVWCIMLALWLIAVITAIHAAATLDTARDLHWAWQIASGQSFPLIGPLLAQNIHLTPLWFYLLALPLLMLGSLNAASIWVGALAGLQYPLALALGHRLLDWRLGLLLALTLALPSLTSYTLVTWTHISIANTTVLLFALALERDWRTPSISSAVGLGLSVALMTQAHPTLLALTWPVLVSWWRAPDRWCRALVIALPAALGLYPLWLSLGDEALQASQVSAGAINAAVVLDAPRLIIHSVVYGTDASLHLIAEGKNGLLVALRMLMLAVGLLAIWGWISGWRKVDRHQNQSINTWLLALLSSVLVYALAVALMRPVTWWYMMLGLIPPIALMTALGLHQLPSRLGHWSIGTVSVITLSLMSISLVISGTQGISRYFPIGFVNLKQSSPQQDTDNSPWLPLYAQDRVAQAICTEDQIVTLHGTLAFTLDSTGRLLHQLHCPDTPSWQLLGTNPDNPAMHRHWLGIQAKQAATADLAVAQTIAGMALIEVRQVLYPRSGLAMGNAASEQLRGWAQPPASADRLDFTLAGADRVAIGNAFYWQSRPEWIRIDANGSSARLLLDDGVTQVYECASCDGIEAVNWTLEFAAASGYPPDIVVPARNSIQP
ncbi:MAG: hypothetical protein AAGH65_03910 [Pseudomonadota bacterium]